MYIVCCIISRNASSKFIEAEKTGAAIVYDTFAFIMPKRIRLLLVLHVFS